MNLLQREHNQNNYGLSIAVSGIDILLECGASILRVTTKVSQSFVVKSVATLR